MAFQIIFMSKMHGQTTLKLFKSANENVANNLLRDVEHSHYKGLLYSQTVIRKKDVLMQFHLAHNESKAFPDPIFQKNVNYSTA